MSAALRDVWLECARALAIELEAPASEGPALARQVLAAAADGLLADLGRAAEGDAGAAARAWVEHLIVGWGLGRALAVERRRGAALALGGEAAAAPGVLLARALASHATRSGAARALTTALASTATLLELPAHPASGLPLVDDERRCGTCAWRGAGGVCQYRPSAVRTEVAARACSRHLAELGCDDCGACCREAFDLVPLGRKEPLAERHPHLVAEHDGLRVVRRDGDRCAALRGDGRERFHCIVYDDRPRTCRELALGGPNCLLARRRVGLSL